jgi:hypothetical protein
LAGAVVIFTKKPSEPQFCEGHMGIDILKLHERIRMEERLLANKLKSEQMTETYLTFRPNFLLYLPTSAAAAEDCNS